MKEKETCFFCIYLDKVGEKKFRCLSGFKDSFFSFGKGVFSAKNTKGCHNRFLPKQVKANQMDLFKK